jgi:hypothetical protein
MKTMRQPAGWCLAGLGFALLALSGCQTETVGMCLPWVRSGGQPPSAVASTPRAPLQRETASPPGTQVASGPRQD